MRPASDASEHRGVAEIEPQQPGLFVDDLDGPWQPPDDGDVIAAEGRRPARLRGVSHRKATAGEPLQVPIDQLDDDPLHPRGDYPPERLDDLARDIAERGILQAIVVAPPDKEGRYRIRFGVQRWRAARLAGLATVPVAVRAQPCEVYDQVAENLKRHGLSPLQLAQFFRSRIEAGESNATIARKLAIDQTTVAHHLSLLDLAPVLEAALASGRCTSPRTLHELQKLHEQQPDEVAALLAGEVPLTRETVAALRTSAPSPVTDLFGRSQVLCDRLERLLTRLAAAGPDQVPADHLATLRQRLAALAQRLAG